MLVSCKLSLLSKSMQMQSNPALIPDSPSLFWKFYPFMETTSGKNFAKVCCIKGFQIVLQLHQIFKYFLENQLRWSKPLLMVKLSRFLPKTEVVVHRSQVFYKKTVLKSFKKFTRKHISKRLFLSNVAGLLPIRLFFKKSSVQAFSCEFCQIFNGPLLQSTSGLLLLLHILLLLLLLLLYTFAESTLAPKCYSGPVFLFPLNIFKVDNVGHLHLAISGVPRQLVVTELIYC